MHVERELGLVSLVTNLGLTGDGDSFEFDTSEVGCWDCE